MLLFLVLIQSHLDLSPMRCQLEQQYKLELPRSSTGKDVKDHLHRLTSVPNSMIRIFFRGVEIRNNWPLYFVPSSESLMFTISNDKSANQQACLEFCGPKSFSTLPLEPRNRLFDALFEAQAGLQRGLKPLLAMDGTGGTYFLRNTAKDRVGCFKPRDEEPSAPNNPRGLVDRHGATGLRPGILSGEATEREIACFLTDRDGFSGVPPTALVEAVHPGFSYLDGEVTPKVGSFQLYVDATDVASDLSPSLFPAAEVHKIALLDIRMVNTDRNDANILVNKRKVKSLAGCRSNARGGHSNARSDHLNAHADLSSTCMECGKLVQTTTEPSTSRPRFSSVDTVESWPETFAFKSSSPRLGTYDPNGSSAFIFESSTDDTFVRDSHGWVSTDEHQSPLSVSVAKLPDDLLPDHVASVSHPSPTCGGADGSECACPRLDPPKPASQYTYQLTPIDHGYCLPSSIEIAWCDWCWLDWPQTEVPFDQATIDWVAQLDPDADANLLREELDVREECLKNMKISTLFLKMAVHAGLVLRDIAAIMVRDDMDKPSMLEDAVSRATELAKMMLRNTRVRAERSSSKYSTKSLSPTAEDTNLHSNSNDGDKSAPRSFDFSQADRKTDRTADHRRATLSTASPSITPSNRAIPLIRVASFDDGQRFPSAANNDTDYSHRIINIHGEPVRVQSGGPQRKSSMVLMDNDLALPNLSPKNFDVSDDQEHALMDSYFFTYFERLIDDAISTFVARRSARTRAASPSIVETYLATHGAMDPLDLGETARAPTLSPDSDPQTMHSSTKQPFVQTSWSPRIVPSISPRLGFRLAQGAQVVPHLSLYKDDTTSPSLTSRGSPMQVKS